jgi:hypothetical protein
MTEPYQAEVTKIKTVLWNAQHICKNAKANPELDTNAELQAAIDKIVDAEELVGALHRDILTDRDRLYNGIYNDR